MPIIAIILHFFMLLTFAHGSEVDCSDEGAEGCQRQSFYVDIAKEYSENVISKLASFDKKNKDCVGEGKTQQKNYPLIQGREIPAHVGPISVVSPQRAQDLTRAIVQQSHIPWKISTGCEARAHEVARLLSDSGVRSAKIFISAQDKSKGLKVASRLSPKGKPTEWSYHVASSFYVIDEKGRSIAYVIDPYFSDQPISVQSWVAQIQKSNPDLKVSTTYAESGRYMPPWMPETLIENPKQPFSDEVTIGNLKILEQLQVRQEAFEKANSKKRKKGESPLNEQEFHLNDSIEKE
jgi:hypothetical protein